MCVRVRVRVCVCTRWGSGVKIIFQKSCFCLSVCLFVCLFVSLNNCLTKSVCQSLHLSEVYLSVSVCLFSLSPKISALTLHYRCPSSIVSFVLKTFFPWISWTKVTCSASFETWCKQVLFIVKQRLIVECSSFQMVKQDGIPPLEIRHFLSSFLMVRMLDRLFENLTTPQPDTFQATIQNLDVRYSDLHCKTFLNLISRILNETYKGKDLRSTTVGHISNVPNWETTLLPFKDFHEHSRPGTVIPRFHLC